MKNILAKFFGGNQSNEPRALTDIVASFESQVIELDNRIELDTKQIEDNQVEINKLKFENATKTSDIERANRIKSNIKSFIE